MQCTRFPMHEVHFVLVLYSLVKCRICFPRQLPRFSLILEAFDFNSVFSFLHFVSCPKYCFAITIIPNWSSMPLLFKETSHRPLQTIWTFIPNLLFTRQVNSAKVFNLFFLVIMTYKLSKFSDKYQGATILTFFRKVAIEFFSSLGF